VPFALLSQAQNVTIAPRPELQVKQMLDGRRNAALGRILKKKIIRCSIKPLCYFVLNSILYTYKQMQNDCIYRRFNMATSLVQVRIDEKLKDEVSEIYENFGIDLPTAIRIFFKKTISVKGLPFDLRNTDNTDTDSRKKVYETARLVIQENNVPEMSLEEINAEIDAARSKKSNS
jgi:DNA-damage-inducible protein J